MSKREFRVVVVTRFGGWRQLYRTPKGKYSLFRKGNYANMTAPEVEAAKRWVKTKGPLFQAVRVVGPNQYPFVTLADGTKWPTNDRLMHALNELGRQRKRRLHIISGWRDPHTCWALRQKYLRGQGNLAAMCCGNPYLHSWAQCGRQPRSNHADGNAADVNVVKNGNYVSVGLDRKCKRLLYKLGMCLPVRTPQYEPWHVEMR